MVCQPIIEAHTNLVPAGAWQGNEPQEEGGRRGDDRGGGGGGRRRREEKGQEPSRIGITEDEEIQHNMRKRTNAQTTERAVTTKKTAAAATAPLATTPTAATTAIAREPSTTTIPTPAGAATISSPKSTEQVMEVGVSPHLTPSLSWRRGAEGKWEVVGRVSTEWPEIGEQTKQEEGGEAVDKPSTEHSADTPKSGGLSGDVQLSGLGSGSRVHGDSSGRGNAGNNLVGDHGAAVGRRGNVIDSGGGNGTIGTCSACNGNTGSGSTSASNAFSGKSTGCSGCGASVVGSPGGSNGISHCVAGGCAGSSDESRVNLSTVDKTKNVIVADRGSSDSRDIGGGGSDGGVSRSSSIVMHDHLEYTPPTTTTNTPFTTSSSCPNSNSPPYILPPNPPSVPADPLPPSSSLLTPSSPRSLRSDISSLSSPFSSYISRRLDTYFHITSRGSTIKTELRAGLILYTTMCYIIVVNPGILSVAGLPVSSVASATAIAAAMGTFAIGLFANLPLGIGPGMGLNTYFAYELVRQQFLPSSSQAFACSCTAGVIFLSLSICGVCNKLINQVPLAMKKAVVVGIGLFQALVGLSSLGIIVHSPAAASTAIAGLATTTAVSGGTLVSASTVGSGGGIGGLLQLGSVGGAEQVMGACTLAILGLFILLEIPAAILLGIVGSTAISIGTGLAPLPDNIWSPSHSSSERSHPSSSAHSVPASLFSSSLTMPWLDFAGAFGSSRGWLCTFFMLFVVFVDTGGVMLGMGSQAAALTDTETGDVINSKQGYVAVGAANVLAAVIGTSPVIIFLESAAAISQGGRTGLCALVASLLFGLSLFFVPLLTVIPASATSPVMVLVGSFMMGAALAIPWDRVNQCLPAFVTIVVTAFSCSMSHGLFAGLFFYFFLNVPFVIAKLTGWRWLKSRLVSSSAACAGSSAPLSRRTSFHPILSAISACSSPPVNRSESSHSQQQCNSSGAVPSSFSSYVLISPLHLPSLPEHSRRINGTAMAINAHAHGPHFDPGIVRASPAYSRSCGIGTGGAISSNANGSSGYSNASGNDNGGGRGICSSRSCVRPVGSSASIGEVPAPMSPPSASFIDNRPYHPLPSSLSAVGGWPIRRGAGSKTSLVLTSGWV
eukprot:GHVS01035698.1.p1 GENE.GHVS01035698.1~~GHVS01035698.1.p1  ORF type:complete len:1118 (+),score=216.78 GHVS01035698.1:320-3673(+)